MATMNGGSRSSIPEGGDGLWTQTRLLVAKNWKCKMRSDKKKLFGEIFVPVLYLCLLSYFVKLFPRTTYPLQTTPDSNPVNVLHGLDSGANQRIISVVPNSNEAVQICERMKDIWKSKNDTRELSFVYYPTLKELEDAYQNGSSGIDLSIVFTEIASATNSFSYTIMTEPGTWQSPPFTGARTVGLDTCRKNGNKKTLETPASCPVNGYFYSGFLGLQYLADQALLEFSGAIDSDGDMPTVIIQNYPKPAFAEGMPLALRTIIPIYAVIPMAQMINNLLVLIVTEKEDRIKDGFRMIGVSDRAYWLSWFSVYSGIIGLLSVIFTIVMHFTSVLRNINIVILFLIFFLFGLSVITFAFALTPFFHKPKTAGIVGTLIMQLCGMLFMLQTFLDTSTDAFLLPMRLISSLAFTTALDQACEYEYSGGIQFSDLLPNARGERILYSLIFICFDTLFYGIIAVYLDNVIPNEYGARKHPLFCFTSKFCTRVAASTSGYRRSSLSQEDHSNGGHHDPNVETVPTSMLGKEAIRIRNVHKTYTSLFRSTKVKAVKGVSLDIYDGQITAILGKNGSGKSTLFSIITGLVPPSSGNCSVFGLNTSDPADMDRLRKITGVCLQTDLLFATLSVEEYLELYGKLRGLKGFALSSEIKLLLEELKLVEKGKTRACNLSGGQKRKLSVAIALIGDPKIILLDEPSAGVDPVSRRHLWSLLKRKREGRVILLTTHFLDEADFLADRKAIIHDGVLKCHGSSLFLKNKFGVGYHLTVETEGPFEAEQCDIIVRNSLPQALSSKHIVGKEIKYCLPHSEVHVFADLFQNLETLIGQPQSAFKSYGVSMTTLEEVFLKISNDAWEDKAKEDEDNANANPIQVDQECTNLIADLNEITINCVESLWVLSLLRIRRLIRSPQSLFFMLVMPSVLVAIGLLLMKAQSATVDMGKMSFEDPKAIYARSSQRRLAFSDNDGSVTELASFLNEKGFNTLQYSGDYSDLLQRNLSEPGTMAAFSVHEGGLNLRINGTFLHSPPLFINMLSQYYWRKYSNNATLNAATKSFPPKKTALDANLLFAAFLIGPAFTFTAVGMVMELVKDREINARGHLRVNGVSFSLYFLSIFIVFGILSAIVTIMQIGLIYIFKFPSFMNPYALIVTLVLLLLFIPSCLLFSTIFSYLFNRLESAQSVFSPMSSWMGSLVGIGILVLDGVVGGRNVLIVHGIFSALDVFYIPFGVFYWVNKQYMLCTMRDNCDELSFGDYLGPEIVIMGICLLVQIPIFSVAVVVADVVKSGGSPMAALGAIFMRRKNNLNQSQINILCGEEYDGALSTSTMEEDVLNEKTHVGNLLNGMESGDNSVVIVQNLMKTYQPNRSIGDRCRNVNTKGYQALKGINFAVEKGEVFGLLGHNGAGKTTAMRIIIAQESADHGRVRLCGSDIDSSYSDAFLKLGYCAQHDPLWENIKLREHLELYAAVRGIPRNMRKRILNQLIVGLQIQDHSDKEAAKLSGGTKRKLSYAISILGSPRIVLMDEPSTGMDPQSKRFLWNTILGSFKESRGAILTTHSMEEAEILCTRIAILAKGSLICIGSPQHLKSKYGKGYILEIKLKPEDPGACETSDEQRYAFVKEHFPECTVNEVFNDKAVFSLPTTSVKSISQAFALLEQLKRENNIEEYSFSQTTLEQIFLQFAKDDSDEGDENAVQA